MRNILVILMISYPFLVFSQTSQPPMDQSLSIADNLIEPKVQSEIGSGILSPEISDLLLQRSMLEKNIPAKSCNNFIGPVPYTRPIPAKTGQWEVVLYVKATSPITGLNQATNFETFSDRTNPMFSLYEDMMDNSIANAKDINEVQTIIQTKTKDLSFEQQMQLASIFANYFNYNGDKASFVQSAWQQDAGLWNMLQAQVNGEDLGVCGDIHSATNRLLKMMNPNLEVYLISYATDQSQHIVSLVQDPNDPNTHHVINYGTIQSATNSNGINSAGIQKLPEQDGYWDMGDRIRVFAPKDNDNDTNEHIATLKTDIGAFMYQMSVNEFEYGATPMNQQNSVAAVDISKEKVDAAKDQTKEDGVKVFQGKLSDGTDVVGLAYYHEKFKNMNEDGTPKNPNQFSMFNGTSAAYATSGDGYEFVDYNYRDYRLYLTNRGQIGTPIIEKYGFKFGGTVGYQVEGGMVQDGDGYISIGDGDATFMGKAFTEYNTKDHKTKLKLVGGVDYSVGLKNATTYGNLKTLPSNIKLTSNAVNATISGTQKLKNNQSVGFSNSFTATAVGGVNQSSFFYQKESNVVYVSLTTPTGGFTKNKINLVPNNTNQINAGFQTQNKKGNLKVGGSAGYNFDYKQPQVNFGVKYNIQGKKKPKR